MYEVWDQQAAVCPSYHARRMAETAAHLVDHVFVLPGRRGAAHCELFALSQADIAAIQTRVSQRVLRGYVRRGWLDVDEARAMRDWHNDGCFSLDAAVHIPGWEPAGLERLLRYCARPPLRSTSV